MQLSDDDLIEMHDALPVGRLHTQVCDELKKRGYTQNGSVLNPWVLEDDEENDEDEYEKTEEEKKTEILEEIENSDQYLLDRLDSMGAQVESYSGEHSNLWRWRLTPAAVAQLPSGLDHSNELEWRDDYQNFQAAARAALGES